MNLFELFVKIDVDDQASGKIGALGEKLGNGLKTAAKIGTAAVGAAAAGITALTAAAVNNYAEYEQLVGGVETLFKDSAGTIQNYADRAFQTAGLSANEYMSTVTSFSASLLQSLDGDTEKAAEYADMAITDMADNANKMGTSMESIQNAYQGFAKQNYTMLDNLKLGYGGTKEEMERLIKDAAKLDKSIDANDMSFGNIVKSINAVQKEMGIYGTTSKEASATITGSLAAVKAQWNNLLTAVSKGDDRDLSVYISNFVDTVSTAMGNLLPVITKTLNGAATLVRDLVPIIVQEIPTIINENLPVLAEAAISIIQGLVDGISQNQEMLMQTAFDTIVFLANSLISMLPQIVALGLELIVSLANGIAESIPQLIPTVVDIVLQIVETLTNPDTLSSLVDASIAIIIGIASGLIEALPQLLEKAPVIVENLVVAIIENVPKLLKAAAELIGQLVIGIVNLLPKIGETAGKIINTIVSGVKSLWSSIKSVGSNIVQGVWSGISEKISWFTSKVKGFFTGIVDGVKSVLGIRSPSKVFATIGGFMAEGLGEGWNDEYASIKKSIENDMNFGVASVDVNSSYAGKTSNALNSAFSDLTASLGQNVTIVVQSVLDGKVIGETAYQYNRLRQKAYGGAY